MKLCTGSRQMAAGHRYDGRKGLVACETCCAWFRNEQLIYSGPNGHVALGLIPDHRARKATSMKAARGWAGTFRDGDGRRIEPGWVGATKSEALGKAMGRLTWKEFEGFQRLHQIRFVRVTIAPSHQ